MIKIRIAGALMLGVSLLTGGMQSASAEEASPAANLSHPRDAALMQQPDGGWAYRKFPEGSQLYVYEGDSPGQSNCNLGCASAWPPLLVTSDTDRIGAWTVIKRDDGQRQWAYKRQPVYYRFHDLPSSAEQLQESGFRTLEP